MITDNSSNWKQKKLIMGNIKSKSNPSMTVTSLFNTATARSDQLFEQYQRDKLGFGASRSFYPSASKHLAGVRLLKLWASGRTVGTTAVKKIHPIYVHHVAENKLNKRSLARCREDNTNTSSFLATLAMCLTQCDRLWQRPTSFFAVSTNSRALETIVSYCAHMEEELELVSGRGELGDTAEQKEIGRLEALAAMLRARVAEVGLALESNPREALDIATLRCWAEWSASHVAVEVALAWHCNATPSSYYIGALVQQYCLDFETLLAALRTNLQLNIGLHLRELSYYTFPAEGQKRWWIDLLVKITERESNFTERWSSKELKVDQLCLTRGFPSTTYVPGAVKDEHFISVWDCKANDLYECNDKFHCVKCGLIERILRETCGRFEEDVMWLSSQKNIQSVFDGLKTFKVVEVN